MARIESLKAGAESALASGVLELRYYGSLRQCVDQIHHLVGLFVRILALTE